MSSGSTPRSAAEVAYPFHDFLNDEERRLFTTKPKEVTA
jgi:hypothetical protein